MKAVGGLAALVISVSLYAPAAMGETISFAINKPWIVQGMAGNFKKLPNNCGEVVSSVRPEETLDNWTELFSMNNLQIRCYPPSAEERYNDKKRYQEKTCPGANQWKVLEKGDNSLIFEHRTTGCPIWPDQIRIGLILDGKWNRWEVEYNVRGDKIKTYKQMDWLPNFSAARVEP
jgi:hypothetical protein